MSPAVNPVPQGASLALDISALTHSGTVRNRNQDAWAVDKCIGLLLVADGVGGQGDGSWASQRAVQLVGSYLRRATRYVRPRTGESRERLVRSAVEFCSRQMRRQAVPVGGKPSGTTLVGFWAPAGADGATVFNVGDSSLFRVTVGGITKISHDHSLHQIWMDGGRVGTEPSKRVITQALGISAEIHPHVASLVVARGDSFVACTDGLTGALSRPEIGAIVLANGSAAEGTRALLADALQHKARDNVTAAVCKVAAR
jgi:protein phosphatase